MSNCVILAVKLSLFHYMTNLRLAHSNLSSAKQSWMLMNFYA